MQPIEICAWCPEWPTQFAVKAKFIRSVLDAHAMRIDHIGSTAIRGLAAKPIIDIQISVADLQSVEVLRERMTAIGYVWRSSNADLTKRYFREAPGNERTHVHVRGRGSWSEQWSLLFRDYMRAHAHEHAPYGELKRALAARYQNDRVAYTEAKSEHLWTIIHRADRWAAQTGWQPGPSDA
ncbi:GrpB family protein [Sinorhizobium sp. NFACC03]|uniref:GrpB family protein n=1 Tax=Sinorhizobium sp. NFACC03 TaxID=1566295 RepID=UPI001AEC830A|nr:GrpB family protein [Sinorhizobium sp. NFACC03]